MRRALPIVLTALFMTACTAAPIRFVRPTDPDAARRFDREQYECLRDALTAAPTLALEDVARGLYVRCMKAHGYVRVEGR